MTRDRRTSREERITRSLAWMERYTSLFGKQEAYRAAIERRPPIDLLVPGGPDDVTRIERSLAARGLHSERFTWAPFHLRVHTEGKGGAGTLPEVIFGLAFPQGVVSCLPALALAPQLGERVLDLCAAPGGKTVLLSALAGDRARILAGDPNTQRCGLLVQSLSRMAISSAMIVRQDGNCFPAVARFEKILLDAPCSGEGIFRVPKPRYAPSGSSGIERAQALQKRLLSRALDLLAPGGRLVYSTCTFAPEENEQVLDNALASRDDLRIRDLPKGFPGAPGVTRWGKQRFDPRLERARRLYPQMTGSWGFFLALLEKDPASGRYASRRLREDEEPAPPTDDPEARAELVEQLKRRFGVPASELEEYIVQRKARDIWILARLPDDAEEVQTARLHVVAPGLRALRATGRGPRVTNALLRLLQNRLRERIIDLSWETLLGLLDARRMALTEALSSGQVALRCEGRVVAAGFVRDGILEMELPKAWR